MNTAFKPASALIRTFINGRHRRVNLALASTTQLVEALASGHVAPQFVNPGTKPADAVYIDTTELTNGNQPRLVIALDAPEVAPVDVVDGQVSFWLGTLRFQVELTPSEKRRVKASQFPFGVVPKQDPAPVRKASAPWVPTKHTFRTAVDFKQIKAVVGRLHARTKIKAAVVTDFGLAHMDIGQQDLLRTLRETKPQADTTGPYGWLSEQDMFILGNDGWHRHAETLFMSKAAIDALRAGRPITSADDFQFTMMKAEKVRAVVRLGAAPMLVKVNRRIAEAALAKLTAYKPPTAATPDWAMDDLDEPVAENLPVYGTWFAQNRMMIVGTIP